MQHSSQVTKEEYENKHEKDIATKMANVWERKIGTDKVHASPVTVVNSLGTGPGPVPGAPKAKEVKLTKAGSTQPSDALQKKRTKEIVQNFEKMSSPKGSKSAVSVSSEKTSPKIDKGEICALIAKLAGRISEMDETLKELQTKIDAL